MNFEQIQCFIAAVEEKTFLDAAESLHISQSSLSKQISRLEQELGVSLWDRSRRKAGLTKAGTVFYQDALTLQRQYTEARNRLQPYRAQSVPALSVGTLPVLSQYHLTPVLRNFQKAHPDIRLKLYEVEEPELMDGLNRGAYDFVIARESMFDPALHDMRLIASDRLAAVLPCGHPLATRAGISLEELAQEDFILMNPYTSIYKLCLGQCSLAGFTPNILRTARVESILSAVAVGEGISLLAADSVRLFKPEQVVVVPLEPEIILHVVLARRNTGKVTRSMRLLWESF